MATVVSRHQSLPAQQARPREATREETVLRVGFWSAVATAIFYIGWLIGMASSFFLPSPWERICADGTISVHPARSKPSTSAARAEV